MGHLNYITTSDVDSTIGIILYILSHPFVVMWIGMLLHFIQREKEDAVREARAPAWSKIFSGKGVRAGYGAISAVLLYAVTMPSSEKLGVVSDDVMYMMRMCAFAIGFGCESAAAAFAEKGNSAKLPGSTP